MSYQILGPNVSYSALNVVTNPTQYTMRGGFQTYLITNWGAGAIGVSASLIPIRNTNLIAIPGNSTMVITIPQPYETLIASGQRLYLFSIVGTGKASVVPVKVI